MHRDGQLENDISSLVVEYSSLLRSASEDEPAAIERALVADADWTPLAAQHLVRLAKDYGAFMLRNAAALATALGVEDGELGF
jgi:hypothetical protein